MSAGSSDVLGGFAPLPARSSVAALLVLGALALAGCPTHEPDAKPFHIKVTVLSTAVGLVESYTQETLVDLTGTASREDGQSLLVQEAVVTGGIALGDVRITFDGRGSPLAAFPASLHGRAVRIRIRLAPEGRGPDLEPLQVPGIRVLVDTAGVERSVFMLFEGIYVRDRVARLVSPAAPTEGEAVLDFPVFYVDEQSAEAEPGECGLAYYDRLVVGDPTTGAVLKVLGRGEREQALTIAGEPELWTVAHSMSYHRDGACEGQSKVYTQLAAWRTPVTE